MNINDAPTMILSLLVFISAVFGALNMHQYLRNRHVIKECKALKEENFLLMSELNELYNKNPVLKKEDYGNKPKFVKK